MKNTTILRCRLRGDAAVVLACIAIAIGAVGVDVAPHAPACVGVADRFATTTFIV